ncbi:MAG: lytic transglycosylase domain-containing protein [Pseudomonadota bacterium]
MSRSTASTGAFLAAAALIVLCLGSSWSARAWASQDNYPYQSCFEIASRMHDVPVDLLLAVAATESAWDPGARSHANAHGIMQIQWPGTARHLGVTRVAELYNPCLNIELGTRYLRELLDQSNGDVERALAAYNYGPTRISRETTLPSGAVAYANKVAGHQAKISAKTMAAGEELIEAPGIVFESGTRANRFAQTLNDRIDGARFVAIRESDGTHRVQMHVADSGLTSTDVTTLETLGWSNIGEAP